MFPLANGEGAAGAGPVVRVGVDIVAVARVATLLASYPQSLSRLFTPREIAYCQRKRRRDEHFAGRFAAKEAVLKALGTGLGRRMRWTEVEIVNEASGRPTVTLWGEVAAWAERQGLRNVDVSLSHSAGLAVADAITVWSGQRPDYAGNGEEGPWR